MAGGLLRETERVTCAYGEIQKGKKMGKSTPQRWWRCAGTLVMLVLVAYGAFVWRNARLKKRGEPPSVMALKETGLANLLAAGNNVTQEIAVLNLICAEGLPGAEQLDTERCLGMLTEMASRVRLETERHFYRFKQKPAEFESSAGFFRMLMLTVVLAEDFKVGYDTARRTSSMTATEGDGFFGDSASVFLQGLLGPKRQGTCSSMPVLYVAVGRRLGYPLKLVTTKGHLFVRWEGAGERFNVEATSRGLSRFDDDYYRHWPFEISASEEAAEGYLKSLSPAEELAVFLSIRGMCLREAGRIAEAADCFVAAGKYSPGCASYRMMAEQLRSKAAASGGLHRSS